MSTEERLAALEADNAALKELTQNLTRFIQGGDIPVPNLSLNGSRQTLNTEYWSRFPLGQGACFSIASADRFGAMIEIDDIRCHNFPSTAIYGAVTQSNQFMQNNIGVHGVANNGVVDYGLFCTSGNRSMGFRYQGIELVPGPNAWDRFLIGPVGGPYTQLWPPPVRQWP